MLDCQTCMHTCLRAIYAHALGPAPLRPAFAFQRTAKTSGALAATWSRKNSTALAKQRKWDGGKEVPASNLTNRGVSASKSAQEGVVRRSDTEPTQHALEQELRFLRDPLKLADNTVKLLKNGQHEKAGQLVRMASKSMACTVSWNHMMDYEMSKGRVSRAMTIYNDVHAPSQSPFHHGLTSSR